MYTVSVGTYLEFINHVESVNFDR